MAQSAELLILKLKLEISQLQSLSVQTHNALPVTHIMLQLYEEFVQHVCQVMRLKMNLVDSAVGTEGLTKEKGVMI